MHDDWFDHDHYEHLKHEEQGYDEGNTSERITLNTVGIDIGSSTTHLIFSKVVLVRRGKELSSRYVVVQREIVYESPVFLTPYKNPTTIDTEALRELFADEYEKAGQTVESVDTGAVIVTGEAAMKENAENIISLFSAQAGKFVCATAGPNLEAVLAAHGSGAVRNSEHKTVLNIDIGGGTTKFALAHNGHVLETSAVSIGARLMAWDGETRLKRKEKTADYYMSELPDVGHPFPESRQTEFASRMTECLMEITEHIKEQSGLSEEKKRLYLTPSFVSSEPVDEVVFSGGVAEFIYDCDSESKGDFGLLMGQQIRNRLKEKQWKLGVPAQRIRATVIGASQYTVQVSGNTIFLTNPEIVPIRSVPVVSLDLSRDDGNFDALPALLGEALQRIDLEEGKEPVAIGIKWPQTIHYQIMSRFCKKLFESLTTLTSQPSIPLILMFDNDVAALLGRLLQEECSLKCPIVSIDGIDIRELDYIDIGEMIEDTNVVPVVIKSLVFK